MIGSDAPVADSDGAPLAAERDGESVRIAITFRPPGSQCADLLGRGVELCLLDGVTTPIRAVSRVMSAAAIRLHATVVGYRSPCPTVVMVNIGHHNASPLNAAASVARC